MLHWKYGSKREDIINGKPAFLTNNFCISKQLFLQLSFPYDWQGYGHEDSWMGMELERLGADIKMINNPVLHIGVEDAEVFLSKSLQALHNLLKLSEAYNHKLLSNHIKLFRFYTRLRQLRMTGIVRKIFERSKKVLEKNLHSCNPSLLMFDIYRLGSFIQLKDELKTRS
jgi:hypothetical protein